MIDPGELDITVYQGATFRLVVYALDANGDAVDLSAYSGVTAKLGGGELLTEGEYDLGASITDAVNGEITMHVDEADTLEFLITDHLSPAGRPSWDLVANDGTDIVPVLIGAANIKKMQAV